MKPETQYRAHNWAVVILDKVVAAFADEFSARSMAENMRREFGPHVEFLTDDQRPVGYKDADFAAPI